MFTQLCYFSANPNQVESYHQLPHPALPRTTTPGPYPGMHEKNPQRDTHLFAFNQNIPF